MSTQPRFGRSSKTGTQTISAPNSDPASGAPLRVRRVAREGWELATNYLADCARQPGQPKLWGPRRRVWVLLEATGGTPEEEKNSPGEEADPGVLGLLDIEKLIEHRPPQPDKLGFGKRLVMPQRKSGRPREPSNPWSVLLLTEDGFCSRRGRIRRAQGPNLQAPALFPGVMPQGY